MKTKNISAKKAKVKGSRKYFPPPSTGSMYATKYPEISLSAGFIETAVTVVLLSFAAEDIII
ncbi:hypothetical protein JET68_07225 [Pseudomonas monteilii]|uniref:hypothetical protein n=1 Tax=Pseudomonas TaxID=286 RepID=UPI0018E67936|nr:MULTISPECIES: hypothetical protein [Pseudomonas]MBI6918588.1 hypothetical protein [Pseudomonas monteilii]MCE0937429.1 hypothetical protein [Pseudomonas kurunegalensis]